MVTSYVDASAAMKLLFEERESEATLAYFTESPRRRLLSSWLLHTELHCAINRRGAGC